MGGVERGDPVRVGCVRANSASAALCGNDCAGVHLPHRSQVTSLLGRLDGRILEAVNSEGAHGAH